MADTLIPIQNMIYEIRGQKVMLDSDLAELYGVPTYRLNEAVKRNIKRFPVDFMFQYVFTEQGVAMLAAVLNSPKAIDVNIGIMRALYDKTIRQIVQALNNLVEQPKETRKIGFNP